MDEITEEEQAEVDALRMREATRARMAAKRAARRAGAARAEEKRLRAQARQVRSKQQKHDAKLKIDLTSMRRRLSDQQRQVKQSYRDCVETERRIKYELYLEMCRCTPHMHADPWKPTPSNVGNTFATDKSLATGNIITGGVGQRRDFPRRPPKKKEKRAGRKPWSPPKTGAGTENILHDPRNHRPMTARSSEDYERAIKAMGKKPRPNSASASSRKWRSKKSRSRQTPTFGKDVRSFIPDGISLRLPWYTMSIEGRATSTLPHQARVPHRPASANNSNNNNSRNRRPRPVSATRRCFNSPRQKEPFKRVIEARLDETRAHSGLDGRGGGMIALAAPLYSEMSQKNERVRDIFTSFTESRASAREARDKAKESVVRALDHWIKAERAEEYRSADGHKKDVQKKLHLWRASAERINTQLNEAQALAQAAAEKCRIAKEDMARLRTRESEIQAQMASADAGLAAASDYLVAPINASLNRIDGSNLRKRQENGLGGNTTKSDVAAIPFIPIFTVKTLKSMIPDLPKRKAMLEYDPDAAEKAKKAKAAAEARAKKGIKRKPRTAQEVILTALSLIVDPEAYAKRALESSGNNVITFDYETPSDVDKPKYPTHSARGLLETTPYTLVDDMHFESMPFVMNEIGNSVFGPACDAEALKGVVGKEACDEKAAKKLRQLLASDSSDQMRQHFEDLFREFDTDKSGKIDISEMKALFAKAGKLLTTSECEALMTKVEEQGGDEEDDAEDGDCMISEAEFVSMMMAGGQNALSMHVVEESQKRGMEVSSEHHSFFDPIPEPWQVREMSRILGGPFEPDSGPGWAEKFDPEYLKIRDASLNDIQNYTKPKNNTRLRTTQVHLNDPLFLLTCVVLSLLKLWRELYKDDSDGGNDENEDEDGSKSCINNGSGIGLRESLAIRKRLREKYRLHVLPMVSAGVKRCDDAETVFNEAQELVRAKALELQELNKKIGKGQAAFDAIDVTTNKLVRLNLPNSQTSRRAKSETNKKNPSDPSAGELKTMMLKWDTPIKASATVLRCMRTNSDARIQEGGCDAVLSIQIGGGGAPVSKNKSDESDAYQLVDSAAAYLRLVTKVLSPPIMQFGGVVLSSPGCGAGCIDATFSSLAREILILFPQRQIEEIEVPTNPRKRISPKHPPNTPNGTLAKKCALRRVHLLKAIDTLQRATSAKAAMVQALQRVPSISARLGGVNFNLPSKFFTHVQTRLPTSRFWNFGLAGCIFPELKEDGDGNGGKSRIPQPSTCASKKNKALTSGGIYSSFGMIPALDRDRDDFELCKRLLVVAVEQEKEGSAEGEGEDACCADYPGHRAAKRIRKTIASSAVQSDLSILVVRLSSHQDNTSRNGKEVCLNTNFDTGALAPFRSVAAFQGDGTSADSSFDANDANKIMSALLFANIFADISSRTLRQHVQGNKGHKDAPDVLVLSESEGLILNPVRVYACRHTGTLVDLARTIRRCWAERIQFKSEGDTQTGRKRREAVKPFVLQQILTRRGSVLVNNPRQGRQREGDEEIAPSINRIGATASNAVALLLREATLRAKEGDKTICLSDSSAMDNMRLLTCPPWITVQ
jgi:hypothetical protein